MSLNNLTAWGVVVLAAGQGKRLGCIDTPKVMSLIGGKPIVSYTVATLKELGFSPEQICLVVGFAHEKVREFFNNQVRFVYQAEQLGTAHAAFLGVQNLASETNSVLIMGGDDSAFYTPETLTHFMEAHEKAKAKISVLTTRVVDPTRLGRIIRDEKGNCVAILEKEQISPEQVSINEVNTGTYCVDRVWYEALFPTMSKIEGLGEYGLNRAFEMAIEQGEPVQAVAMDRPEEWFGVNTPEELAEADRRKNA